MRGPCAIAGCDLPRAPRSNFCYAHLGARRRLLAERRFAREGGPPPCATCGQRPRQLYYSLCRPCWLVKEQARRDHERAMSEKHRQELLARPAAELREARTYRQQWQGVVQRARRVELRADVRTRFDRVFEKAMRKRIAGPARDTLHDLGRDEALEYVEALS